MAERPTNLHTKNFYGMDSTRTPVDSQEYGVGQLAVNFGRELRNPLHPRRGLRPVSNPSNTTIAGPVLGMGIMLQGERSHLIARLSNGNIVIAKEISVKDYIDVDS